jgi:hypothetical protein
VTIRRRLALAYARSGLAGLEKIGAIHGTDKFTHSAGGENYLAVYERFLRSRRRRKFTLLELGVYRGDSLRTWRDYFRNATIVGLDVDPAAPERAAEFEVYVGSQHDTELLGRVRAEHPDLEVVVDDASHLNPLTFASFACLFPQLPSGGVYIIEDLAPGGYGRDWPGADAHSDGKWGRGWPGMSYGPELSLLDNRRADLEAFRNGLAYDCDLAHWDESLPGHVAFVHQRASVLIVGRA